MKVDREMKIDFELLDRMKEAGATAGVIIAMLRADFEREETRKAAKRPRDAKRIRTKRAATKGDRVATPSDTERHAATLSDTPRARLFREGKPALLTMNIADSRAGALIVQWLKLTNDDDQLVLATILRAQSMAVAEAPSWILATLKGKLNEHGPGNNRNAQQSGSAAILAGVGEAAERRGRERRAAGQHGPAPGDGDVAREPDPYFFGASHG